MFNDISQRCKQWRIVFYGALAATLFCIAGSGCQSRNSDTTVAYTYMEPSYADIGLVPQKDTLHFPLGDSIYNAIGSFNYFTHNGVAFMSFFDRSSKSINIYDFSSQSLAKVIPLKKWTNKAKLDKASIHVRNFDSIYVTTRTELCLFDSTGRVRSNIEFPKEFDKWGFFSNTAPAVFKDNKLFMGIKPFLDEKSVKAQRQWRLLYELDLDKKTKQRHYLLSAPYQSNLYGYSFLEYSYCLNDKGNFVISFAADTNIYETNLANYHKAYTGRSHFQKGDIKPVTLDDLQRSDSYQLYCLRDSYGSIFYDPFRKRYLREAKQRMTEAEFIAKTGRKKKSIIIFDESFKIIGERETNGDFSFTSIFFTSDGRMYARVNVSDEHALHFVRLTYNDRDRDTNQLAQHPMPGLKK